MASSTPISSDVQPAASRAIVLSPYGFNKETEGLQVAEKFASIISGKTVLITGVSDAGLGGEAAISIAFGSPGLLILSARSKARAEPVVEKILAGYPAVKVQILECDLGSLDSVRKAAKDVKVEIDVLINNAAVMACPYSTTSDGFETQFGVAHLGHFLLTNLLLEDRKIKDGGRVVNVSSDGHRLGPVRFDDPGFKGGSKYNYWEAYGQAKTANMLFSLALAERLKSRNIMSFSLHPGVISTGLGRYLDESSLPSLRARDAALGNNPGPFKQKTKQQGAATYLVAAFDPSIADYNGGYLEDCTVFKPIQPWASDPEGVRKLWILSEEMVGERFAF